MRKIVVSEFESFECGGWLDGFQSSNQPSHSKRSERRNGAQDKLNVGLISKEWR
jgi:hypothetical protein